MLHLHRLVPFHWRWALFNRLDQLEQNLMSSLDTLQAQVNATDQVMASAVVLITGLSDQLNAALAAAKAGDNHVALDTLATDLQAKTIALAAAVAAVSPTPAAPPAPPPTPDTPPAAAGADTVAAAPATGS